MPLNPRLLRPRASGGFSPKSIADLALWLDAADASTITLDTGVSEWRDKSGNGFHVAQDTASKQPSYGSDTLNGRNILAFDGNHELVGSSNPFAGDLDRTIFVVWAHNSSSASFTNVFGNFGNAVVSGKKYDLTNEIGVRVFGGTSISSFGAMINGEPAAVTIRQDSPNSTAIRLYKNGQLLAQSFSSAQALDTEDEFQIGFAGGNRLDGIAAEVVGYTRALTDAERESVENYLLAKWGLASDPYPDGVATDSSNNVISSTDYTDGNGDNWRAHTFTDSGTLTFSRGGEVEYLIVAGGGGGGGSNNNNGAAGGGAGGLLAGTAQVTSQGYAVVVGAGGTGTLQNVRGDSGVDSSALGLTAAGGGGGGGANLNNTGASGGSGGGGGSQGGTGGAGTSGQGNAGGDGTVNTGTVNDRAGGGGGGAGGAGQDAADNDAGDGGVGVESAISGTATYYAGGGGGGGRSSGSGGDFGSGGLGGGGNGGAGLDSPAGENATANTGGGGGGGGGDAVNANASPGGNGGSGVVIVRYRR